MSRNLIAALPSKFILLLICLLVATSAQSGYDEAPLKTRWPLKKYVNTKESLNDQLKENFVDFSFQYPAWWTIKENGRSEGTLNFVKVEREINDKTKGSFTQENFAIGYFIGTGDTKKDQQFFPKLAQQLNTQFDQGFPKYKRIFAGFRRIGIYRGYEFRFRSRFDKTPRGPVTIWGRTVLISNPKAGDRKGVALLMLATSLAPEIKRSGDVGVKGQMPIILRTFRFGKPRAVASKPAARPSKTAAKNPAKTQ